MVTMKTAVIEIHDEDGDTVSKHFARDVEVTEAELKWVDADLPEELDGKTYPALTMTDQGEFTEVVLADGGTARVRPLDPYDGVNRSPAGVPQPLTVLEADVLRGGGVMAQELSALVAPDNTVVTLMLETELGLYVRFSGDWQLVSSSSTALEDMETIPVSPEALEVFDRADMARATLSAFDLPRIENTGDGVEVKVLPDPRGVRDELNFSDGGVVVASGILIPPVDTVDDLDLAIKYGEANPAARWYIVKRAKALGASGRVPAGWTPRAVVHPF